MVGPLRFLHAASSQSRPSLAVVIDTEEEFDWRAPFSRSAVSADNLREQGWAQDILTRHGVVPMYVVNYAAARAPGATFLYDVAAAGLAEIGAHLHPWNTPPFREPVNARNSYGGNLPPLLERAKLNAVTHAIADRFERRPTAFRAGRYGLGPQTGEILAALGYATDLSICPHMSFAADGGPAFYGWPDQPFWLDQPGGVVSIPATVAFMGAARRLGARVAGTPVSRMARRLRLAGPAARLGLLERARLSPEGADAAAMIRVMTAALARGDRFLTMTWHSSTLAPGRNLYVRDAADRAAFLARINTALTWFQDQGGVFTTVSAMDQAHRQTSAPAAQSASDFADRSTGPLLVRK